MNKTATILLLTLIAACASVEPLTSMRGSDVAAADSAPLPASYQGSAPGSQPRIARTFAQQPPLIPHDVANFLDINLKENTCLECHSPENHAAMSAPKIGDSHLLPGGDKVSAARYVCVSCHVPQIGASPLVENRFVGNLK